MRNRTLSGLLVAAFAFLLPAARAEEPRGRARTWDLEANLGLTVLDTGFDRNLLGYTLNTPPNGSSKVPETRPDHLVTQVPTLGLRATYNFTRYFGLEASGLLGETEIDDNTYIKLQENFALNPSIRKQVLNQQTATAPNISAAYDTLKWDYTNGSLVGVFKFNNRSTNRLVFFGTLGSGYYILNTSTTAFNACAGASELQVFDPSAPVDQNGDGFDDNPQQLVVKPQCDRGFETATQTGVRFNPQTGLNEPVLVLGSFYQDSVPWLVNQVTLQPPANFPGCGQGGLPAGNQTFDLDSLQILCGGQPTWQLEPGSQLATSGFSTINRVRSIENWYYTLGGGLRWHIRPRQTLRFDLRRHFDENNNKNINEFTVGYSFVLGRGKPDLEPIPPAGAPEPGGEDGAVPPPAGDDGVS